MLRHRAHPVFLLLGVPAHPVRLEHADCVSEIERKADPPWSYTRVAKHHGLHGFDGAAILGLQVDKQHVDDAITTPRLLQGEVEEYGAVLAAAVGDADHLEAVEDEPDALSGGVEHVDIEVRFACHSDPSQ